MFRRHEFEVLRLMLESVGLDGGSPQSCAQRQHRRLRRLVRYAAQASPYYADLFSRAGVKPETIRTAADLARLPTLAPQTIRDAAARILSAGVDPARCMDRRTTGTTGCRLVIPTPRLEIAFETLMLARGYARCGVRPWHRQAKISVPNRIPPAPRLLQRCGVFRRVYVSTAETPERKVAWLRQQQPDVLMCWASVLNELLLCLERDNTVLPLPRVFSSSDMLWPDVRARAEERMKAKVTNWYGAIETGPIGWECVAGAFHLDGHNVIVELLDEANCPAPRGRVVCTPLWRYAFPLLRCELGDYAAWAEGRCACGRGGPALRNFRGRELDLIRLPAAGIARIPQAMLWVLYRAPGVRQCQFVQRAPERYLLRIVPGPDFSDAVERDIHARLREAFGGEVQVRIVKTAAIRLPPGVKFTPVVTLERLDRFRAQGGDPSVFFDVA